MGVYDVVVDRVTRKLRDLDSSGLKAVKLIVKHSDAARRGTVGEPANYLLFQDVCQGTGFGPAARILALNPKTAIIFSLRRVLSCIHIFLFPKTQMEKSELLRFWLCLFRCHLRRCDFSLLIITDCGATNTSPVLSFMTEGRRREKKKKKTAWNELKSWGGGEAVKKSSTPIDKFDMKLCEVAFHSLNVEEFFFFGGGDQHWLSNQCRGERRIPASATPRGGNESSSCFPVDLSPGWHVLFSSPTHSEANRLIWAISTGRHGCSHLNRVAWTRLTVAWLPAHSGQFVIAVRGAIVGSCTILFIAGQISHSASVCFWTSFTLWKKNRCWRNVPQ